MDYKAAENLETAVVESIGPVEAPAKIETPPTITLEGAGAEGRVTIGRAAEEDGEPKTEDRVEVAADERVMIDTVPLPETPAAGSEEAIGTWPTPGFPSYVGRKKSPSRAWAEQR